MKIEKQVSFIVELDWVELRDNAFSDATHSRKGSCVSGKMIYVYGKLLYPIEAKLGGNPNG